MNCLAGYTRLRAEKRTRHLEPNTPNRIVLIEDNRGDVELLRQGLQEQPIPFHLEVLSDGELAVQFVRSHCRGGNNPEPCLIVLDLHLPRYDGIAVLRIIKSDPDLADVKVVVLTTIASPAERAEALSLGVDAYRTKPTDWDGVVLLARELMEICTQPRKLGAHN